MKFYIYLKENATLNQFKNDILPNIHQIQDLIVDYLYTEEDKEESNKILGEIINQLNVIINKLNSLGYTYSPEVNPDVSEDKFRTILDNFREEFSNLYNNLTKEMIESFNSQIKYILNLIEVHRTNFIEEGETLIDD